MIGHLQSRKYKILSENFSMLHSLDSLKLAKKISLYNSEIGRTTPVLLECNVSGEVSKFGWSIRGEHSLEVVINEFRELSGLKGIKVYGLMCMTPYSNNPEESRPYFKSMKQFLEILKKEISTIEWQELSMGMSGEYEIAIQEGATIVRIGTSIMGPRQ
jgi:pyridoxal phosphate enzyme (YggS family)